MTELIVLAFDNDKAAFEVRDKLIELQKSQLIKLADAAVAVRLPDGKVKVKQVVDLAAEGALGGAFWGLLAGILFWMPFMGMALGTLLGALSGSMADYGVDDDFIQDVAKTIEPGHSALFLLVLQATTDRVVDAIKQWHPTVLRTNLSKEQEAKLREAFSDADVEAHLSAK